MSLRLARSSGSIEQFSPPDADQLTGYRRLAIRVIAQAFRDLHRGSPDLQRSAFDFLSGAPTLDLWCELANIQPARVSAKVAPAPTRRLSPASPFTATRIQAS
jgi:hypothetical protein